MKLFQSTIDSEYLDEINEVLISGNIGFGLNVKNLKINLSYFQIKNIMSQLIQPALLLG